MEVTTVVESLSAATNPLEYQETCKDCTNLVWEVKPVSTKESEEHGSLHVKIYLETPPEGASPEVEETESAARTKETSPSETEQHSSLHQKQQVEKEEEIDPSLPAELEASVLQYQRQKRKAEAAKRAGTEMNEDQLHIVHEDDAIIVVNKPAGVLCVPGINSNPSVANVVFEKCIANNKNSNSQDNNDDHKCTDAYSMTAHRLDMDTSGLVVFGKTKSAVSALHMIFRRDAPANQSKRERKRARYQNQKQGENNDGTTTAPTAITKEYEALVCGHLPQHIESGHINLPLQKDIHHPPFMRVSTPHSETLARQVVDALRERKWTNLSKRNQKPSQTEFRVLQREYLECQGVECEESIHTDDKNGTKSTALDTTTSDESTSPRRGRLPVTRLALTPITGRTHQLRVHCAAIGFPIVGDPVYGIYGESAFCGGLCHNPVKVLKTTDENTREGGATATTTDQKEEDTNVIEAGGEGTQWRASLSLQKELMRIHPPGDKNMCLHARKLGFTHPISGETKIWEVPPDF
jgi:tRNA pseudouridine32 synthase/23S rRNA pseudouridine746 synthase